MLRTSQYRTHVNSYQEQELAMGHANDRYYLQRWSMKNKI